MVTLLGAGADVDAENDDGWTPLHLVIGHLIDDPPHLADDDRVVRVATLLEAGADVDAKNDDGWTPLHYAASLCLPGCRVRSNFLDCTFGGNMA